jgi:hypothetical protein
MKIPFALLLLLSSFVVFHSRAACAVVRHAATAGICIHTDSPAVRHTVIGRGPHMMKEPDRQVNGFGTLSLAAGLLSVAGVIALIVLWPVAVGLGVALAVGTLSLGVAAILFAFQDDRNIRSHPALSVTGGLLGFFAILPVLFPLSVLATIYLGVANIFRRKPGRKRAPASGSSKAKE